MGTDEKRGSVLMVVLVAVTIAAVIAVSYLSFMNEHRERAGRLIDQEVVSIKLEEFALDVRQAIEAAVRGDPQGQISLRAVKSGLASCWPEQEFTLDFLEFPGKDGFATSPLWVENPGERISRHLTGAGDPFYGAKAQVATIRLEAQEQTREPLRVDSNRKTIQLTPEIQIREIPLSQFTVFSAASHLHLNGANFAVDDVGSGAGRIFSQGNVTVSGSLETGYPIVTGADIHLGGSLVAKTSPDATAPEALKYDVGDAFESMDDEVGPSLENSVIDESEQIWLEEARTKFDSAIVNPSVLPVHTALAPQLERAADGNASLDIPAKLRTQCDIEVIVDAASVTIGHGEYRVAIGRGRGANTSRITAELHQLNQPPPPELGQSNPNHRRDLRAKQQDRPFVAKRTQYGLSDGSWRNGVFVLSFNYSALPAELRPQVNRIYFQIENAPSNAYVLIRGAQRLAGGFSIVTPHRILIGGDFNTVEPQAVSIITGQNVRAEAENWGDLDFGYPVQQAPASGSAQ
jgi:hypothetical protein